MKHLQKMPGGRPKSKLKRSPNSDINSKLSKTRRRQALDKARHDGKGHGEQGHGEEGGSEISSSEQGKNELGRGEQGLGEKELSGQEQSDQGVEKRGGEQGFREQELCQQGISDQILEDQGIGEENEKYMGGKSDSEEEIELPDSEYEEEAVTVKHSEPEAVSKVKSDESEEQEKERISSLRQAARNKQWANRYEKEQVKEAVKEEKLKEKAEGSGEKKAPSSQTILNWKTEMKSLLPPCFEQQLTMLGFVSKSFPECSPISCEKPRLCDREGKSSFYRNLETVKQFLEPIPVKAELLLSWASDLAITDYDQFKAHGLSFSLESDIPVRVLIWEKSEKIKAEVWGNYRREDIRRLTLDHIITVYKVSFTSDS